MFNLQSNFGMQGCG